MASPRYTRFRFVDRTRKDLLVLIPGWASDGRIFDGLEWDYNYLVPDAFSPFDFTECLQEALGRCGVEKAAILGHSMGAFVAQDLIRRHPGLCERLILAGARKRYRESEIEEAKRGLTQNKRAYLFKFYSMCRLKKGLMKSYLDEFDTDYLLATLDYLGRCEADPGVLKKVKRVEFIHGEDDRIAPLSEAVALSRAVPGAILQIVKGGHFLEWIKQR